MGDRPVDVSLTVDGEAALYSGPGRQGKLRIRNTSAYGITLDPRPGPPGPDDNHVALFLPAGTLSATSLADLVVADGWTLGHGQRAAGDNRWDGLFLLHRTGRSIAPGEEIVVLLHGLAADPGGTAHHVRVVAEYQLLADGPMVGSPLRGSRSVVLHVVPWAHSPADLHLQAGVLDGSSVINRAAVANRVVVGLTATAVDGLVRLVGGRTQLQLSWDVGPADTHWWALCSPAEAQGCEVAVEWAAVDWAAGGPSTVRPEVDREVWVTQTAATWRITVPDDLALAAGQGIALVLDGLMTSHPSGPANLYVTVAGVDDGVTGMFVLKVAKQPSIWSGTGGLTLYAGGDDELLTVRGEFGQPAAVLRQSPGGPPGPGRHGHRLDLFDDNGAVGARLSSAERSHVAHGLDVGDGLRVDGVELTGRDRTLSISSGTGSGAGALDLVAPAAGAGFTIEAQDDGRLRFRGSTVTNGSVQANGNMLVGQGLTVNGPVALGAAVHAVALRLFHGDNLLLADGTADDLVVSARGGLTVLGHLRMNGAPVLAIETFHYTFEVDIPTGRRVADWTPLVIGDRQVKLHVPILNFSVDATLTLVAADGEWRVELEHETEMPAFPPALVTGEATLTVLFVSNALLE